MVINVNSHQSLDARDLWMISGWQSLVPVVWAASIDHEHASLVNHSTIILI